MNVGILCLAATAFITPPAACTGDVPQGPWAERRKALDQAIRACPQELRLYAEYSSLLVAERDFASALHWADKGLAHAPDDATLNLRKGEALVGLSQAKEALAALAKTPESGESQFFRGLAYQLLDEHRPAQECFLDAWKRGDEDPYVLYSLMREDKELGDKAAGVEHFKIMLARFPESVWIHILLGDAHFKKSEYVDAKKEYLAAEKIMPDLFEPNFRLAYLAFEAGEYPTAVEFYRKALAVKPRHTEANIYLGEALRREQKTQEAIVQLRRAIQLDAKSALAYDSLSKALADAGRLREAAEVLGTAEKEFPEESSFPAMRARILNRLGRAAEAKQAARRAQQIIDARNKKDALVGPK